MGRLTTHVLDTALGRPASGMAIDLVRLGVAEQPLASVRTNADGRVDRPLLEGRDLVPGTYELRFHAGDYLRANFASQGTPFLDLIPIRFGVASPDEHYHVPLLLSPFGYSTYRGS